MVEQMQVFPGLPWQLEVLIRLVCAAAAGALVGIEREYRGRPAGLRTHILVSLGAAIMTLASIEMVTAILKISSSSVRLDPSRIPSGLVQGIGFLGAGTILKYGKTIRGLTTAASVWCIAAVGLGFGAGLYLLGAASTILMMITMLALERFEVGLAENADKQVSLTLRGGYDRVDQMRDRIRRAGGRIDGEAVEGAPEGEFIHVTYEVKLRDKYKVGDLVRHLEKVDFVKDFKIE